MDFNINNCVYVQLTDKGRRMHKRQAEELDAAICSANPRATLPDYRPPAEDEDGWSKWQLWSLMSTFGSSMGLACDHAMDMVMRIPEKEEGEERGR